ESRWAGTRRIRAGTPRRASYGILIHKLITVDGVHAVVLLLKVMVEPTVLLPPDNRECSIQRVEVRDLNVLMVLIIDAVNERDTHAEMITLRGRTGGHAELSLQCAIDEVDAHP